MTYSPRKQLTPNFALAEFLNPDDRDRFKAASLAPLYEHRLQMLCETLEIIRAHVESPLIITSGWRSQHRNKRVGGAPYSAHLTGYAADFKSPYLNAPRLAAEIMRLAGKEIIKYDQLIEYPKHVHISIDPRHSARPPGMRELYFKSSYYGGQ